MYFHSLQEHNLRAVLAHDVRFKIELRCANELYFYFSCVLEEMHYYHNILSRTRTILFSSITL